MIDVINELRDFGTQVDIYDPWADAAEVENVYGVSTLSKSSLPNFADYGAIVLAVSHNQFADLTLRQNASQVIFDVKGISKDADARL